uniref:EOG090X07B6 n=1 Tax=Daphnia atkinsoni TaxID=342845 RepID=A0A4Y7LZ96_9CRUS|nr:EOG090X07B6 [Daphnia atkinsoni]
MADAADTRVNLAALKRVDPYAVEIVETGTQVAIYKFNSQSNEWEKTDVEGTLFLYARSGDPRHGFVVMNRLSTENLVEPITRDLEIQLQAPFLLYKNAKLSITGVWFYEESECTRIAQKLEALVKEETQRRRPNAVQEKSNVDIMSLLTKAGQDYEQPHIAEVMQKSTGGTPPRHTGLQSVALMSPMMFTSASGPSEQPVESVRVQTPVQRPAFQPREESHHPYLADNEITPLTKAQLMQAFNYLLKLHDAYVQSLKQSLKTGH